MPAVDDVFGLEFPPLSAIANPAATHYALACARCGYRAALKVGSWIDEKLQCTLRQNEISERLAPVEAIEHQFYSLPSFTRSFVTRLCLVMPSRGSASMKTRIVGWVAR